MLIAWFWWLWVWGFPTLQPEPIRLRPAPLDFTPNGFYIAAVIDDRPERTPFARLLLEPQQPAQAVDMAGGLPGSVETYVRQSLRQNRQLRPIAMRIKQFRLTEKPAGRLVAGQFDMIIAFELIGKDEFGKNAYTLLTTYRGGATYTRSYGQLTQIEQLLQRALGTSLKTMQEYMNRESAHNPKLATALRIEFKDDDRLTRDDTVHYNPNRLLVWDDFRAEPRQASHYAAEIFTSFAYEGHSRVEKGVIIVQLLMKAYVLKNSSWVRDVAKTPYTLNHEQRHFDIVKITLERFKQQIRAENLTLEDYNSEIAYQFLEYYREMNRMEKQYDDETRHGLDAMRQAQWNMKIDEQLRRYGIRRP